jgi:hypothetical protein
MTATRRLLSATTLLLALPLAALAQSDSGANPPPDHGGKPRRGPPPEAIAACNGKAVGTTASFVDREGGTITGVCTQMGDVVAVPRPKRPHGEHDHDGAPTQQQ